MNELTAIFITLTIITILLVILNYKYFITRKKVDNIINKKFNVTQCYELLNGNTIEKIEDVTKGIKYYKLITPKGKVLQIAKSITEFDDDNSQIIKSYLKHK